MTNKTFIAILLCCLTFTSKSQTTTPETPQWRPMYHFTPEKNWTNDPNGLIYFDGWYHLYNQQNPYENKWGHMSWGHAVSRDLIHWKHLPLAIPEKISASGDTTLIFSGCAVWDAKNSSGFCGNGGCPVIIYTGDQPRQKRESQFVAYSSDKGMSFTDYSKNPVIDLKRGDFRDPNVSWNKALRKWLMVVAVPNDHEVQFYTSPNLKDWNLLSSFGPEGYDSASWECPFFLELPVNGNEAIRKWVLVVSAAGGPKGVFMQYFVGTFDGKTFKNDNPAKSILTLDYGDAMYAAIPWNNVPGKNALYIGWLVPGQQETSPWKGQMSIPRDLALKNTGEGIRMVQIPAKSISDSMTLSFKTSFFEKENFEISSGELDLVEKRSPIANAYWIDAAFDATTSKELGFLIAQKKDQAGNVAEQVSVGYDVVTNELFIEQHSALANSPSGNHRKTAPLKLSHGKLRLRILIDNSSLEVFGNDGEAVISTMIYPSADAHGLAFFTNGTAHAEHVKIWDMSAIMK